MLKLDWVWLVLALLFGLGRDMVRMLLLRLALELVGTWRFSSFLGWKWKWKWKLKVKVKDEDFGSGFGYLFIILWVLCLLLAFCLDL